MFALVFCSRNETSTAMSLAIFLRLGSVRPSFRKTRPAGEKVGARGGEDAGRGLKPRRLATKDAEGSSRPAPREGADAADRAGIDAPGIAGGRGGAPEVTTTDVVRTADGMAGVGSCADPTAGTGAALDGTPGAEDTTAPVVDAGTDEDVAATEAAAEGGAAVETTAAATDAAGATVETCSAKTSAPADTGKTCSTPEATRVDADSGARCSDCTSGSSSPSTVRRDLIETSRKGDLQNPE
jgi:hypothetical protein